MDNAEHSNSRWYIFDTRQSLSWFFVIYTLRLKFLYRVCVLIPTPNVPYLMAVKELGKIDSKSQVKVLQLPDLNYFNDIVRIPVIPVHRFR